MPAKLRSMRLAPGPKLSTFLFSPTTVQSRVFGHATLSTKAVQPLVRQPRQFPSSGFKLIDKTDKVEEERLPTFRREDYYPMRLGDVIRSKYQVVAKLGYGTTSTVWLCRDLSHDRAFWTLKVYRNRAENEHELEVYKHLEGLATESEHPGLQHVRRLEESFTIEGPKGTRHLVMVMTPLGMSVKAFQQLQPGHVYSVPFAQVVIDHTLLGLNFLHQEADLVHTDIHSDNLLIGIENESVLTGMEDDAIEKPCERKHNADGTVVYLSQYMLGGLGPLTIGDFGQARVGGPNTGLAMPVPYRAPEVILKMPWGKDVDMWSLGLTIWDLLEKKPLFGVYDTENPALNDAHHLAAMTAVLGRPPLDFLKLSEETKKYWDKIGEWIGPVPLPDIKHISLQITVVKGAKMDEYLDFMGSLLSWVPERRLGTAQAFHHIWMEDFRNGVEAKDDYEVES